jgi:hypothetical protein
MFVRPTLQPMTISGLVYVAAVAPYVRRPPDKHKLRTSVFNLTNIIQNMNVGPEEHKKPNERMPFSCSARSMMQPVINKIGNMLPGWKRNLLSYQ